MESRQAGFFAGLAAQQAPRYLWIGCSDSNVANLVVDNWLQSVRDVARLDRLCELNGLVQARRLCRSTVVQQAWDRGQRLVVHAWVYRLTDGLLRDLGFCAASLAAAEEHYARAAGFGSIGTSDVESRA